MYVACILKLIIMKKKKNKLLTYETQVHAKMFLDCLDWIKQKKKN